MMTKSLEPSWEYLTVYISGSLDFPDTAPRTEVLSWAGKSITQQLNTYAVQGWELFNMFWVSDIEAMATFKRPKL
ncbi:MAG TPA: hypothetical protein VHP83_26825 [Aggregatilineaceae bacterium]|nr:hypothetical protein [Aggregatilineaceae bacterium]